MWWLAHAKERQERRVTSEHIGISPAEEGWTIANDNETYLVTALTCNVLQQARPMFTLLASGSHKIMKVCVVMILSRDRAHVANEFTVILAIGISEALKCAARQVIGRPINLADLPSHTCRL
jgi:hypothetical protein